MKVMGWIFGMACLSASLWASYLLFYQPNSGCATAAKQIQQRLLDSRDAMRTLRSLPRNDMTIPANKMTPYIGNQLPMCPDGGRFVIHVSAPAESHEGGTRTRFHVNCTEHQFHKW
ncbi:MAG: hypothetical protein CMO74_03425 [Verrucomicrobiales bacterium]|nr:hypothetical protein [Verrucomicrobiales bacterium]|tara:strand:+ start:339 stop:686 length:348 start_codon:yes stop_codon:yes gene_type:complete